MKRVRTMESLKRKPITIENNDYGVQPSAPLIKSYEQSEDIGHPNRNTLQDWFQSEKQTSLRGFFDAHPSSTHINRSIEFVSTARELSEKSDRFLHSLSYDNKGTMYAVLSNEDDYNVATVVRMNPFDGPNSTEIFDTIPMEYPSDDKTPLVERARTAIVAFSDELGNDTEIYLQNHEGGNHIIERSSGGTATDSKLYDARALDYELRYDHSIPADAAISSDSGLIETLEQHEASKQQTRSRASMAKVAMMDRDNVA